MTIISDMSSNGNIHLATFRSISLERSLQFLLLDNIYACQNNGNLIWNKEPCPSSLLIPECPPSTSDFYQKYLHC
ncbi:hypothetical protein [Nostoc sp. NZL]|nr:hypothetical protein [Nostoc sp. NZL]MBG1241498.1 hypothetical protein [Nostoc sp. NZL]